MSTLGNFIELEAQKSMIMHILKNSELKLTSEELLEISDEVQNKLLAMRIYREHLKIKEADSLSKVSDEHGADVDAVLDSYVYFSLILENVWLKRMLFKE
jgi:uncharacterized protein YaaW (UPF0174 family)